MKQSLLMEFRPLLTTALLCVTSFLAACASARSGDAKQTQFLEYRAKAETGNAEAQCNLGVCYGIGQGVAQDIIEAYAWLSLASKTIEPAARGCAALARRMSAEQLTRAQQRGTALSVEIEAKPTGSVAR